MPDFKCPVAITHRLLDRRYFFEQLMQFLEIRFKDSKFSNLSSGRDGLALHSLSKVCVTC
jgi:hypothetical protein